jgi:uncharacterized protein involved in type VI secretion and phage assembly
MPSRLIEGAAEHVLGRDSAALLGVASAKVVDNQDSTGQGRVQLEFPWLPEVQPWARVASVGAGGGRGFYSIPQPGDEVLVAFAHGDVTEPFVLGSLWNGKDLPPTKDPTAPVSRRILHTQEGHRLDFDDLKKSVTLETPTGQTAVFQPDSIALQTQGGTATITLETSGAITIEAQTSLTLKAPQINLSGMAVKIEGSSTLQLSGGAICEIQGGLVKIN